MTVKNAFYAQSGGVTAVINATACGLIQEARRHPDLGYCWPMRPSAAR